MTSKKNAPSKSERKTREWIDDFISYVRTEKGLADNTIAAYRRDLELWASYSAAKSLDPAKVKTSHLTGFLDRLRTGKSPASKKMSPASVARTLVAVRSFFKFLAREGYITEDPKPVDRQS